MLGKKGFQAYLISSSCNRAVGSQGQTIASDVTGKSRCTPFHMYHIYLRVADSTIT